MAAKKKSPLNAVLATVAAAVVVYFLYRLFFGRKVQAASTGGYYGGGAGYGSQAGYGTGYAAGNSLGSTLGSLLNKLLGGSSGGGRGAGAGGAGSQGAGAGSASGKGKQAAYGSDSGITDIYNAIREGLIISGPDAGQLMGSQSDTSLGGDSLLNYEPNYFSGSSLSDYQFTPDSLTDFPLMASPSDPSADNWMYLPYEDLQQAPLYETDYGDGGGGGGYTDSGIADTQFDYGLADYYLTD